MELSVWSTVPSSGIDHMPEFLPALICRLSNQRTLRSISAMSLRGSATQKTIVCKAAV
ncbi:MAG: hypothetical protein QM775_11555 [Pirellulales bacterium]